MSPLPRLLPTVVLACILPGGAAHAQTAQLLDIQSTRSGDKLEFLFTLDAQPRSAVASMDGNRLLLTIDGVALAPMAFTPPAGALATKVSVAPSGAASAQITLEIPDARAPVTTIYRNAFLVEVQSQPHLAGAPRAVSTVPGASSGTAATPKSPAHCDEAKAQLAKDAWNVTALGDHALCLVEAGKFVEAGNRLDQLAAFNPDDPRVAQGRARIAQGSPAPAKPPATHAPAGETAIVAKAPAATPTPAPTSH
jgi:hypothetical protein